MDKRTADSDKERSRRLEWLGEARFGLFVHWGIYAAAAGFWKGKPIHGAGEWMMYNGKIPVAEYEHLADGFNPVRFDADQWVRLAKAAGMKYIVITAKHCDGFAMYASEVSKYNIIDATPFGRDPLRELEEACGRHAVRLGFYYSHDWDWHEPDALGYDNTWDFPDRGKKVQDRYIDGKSIPQVAELVTRYHPHIIWFDVPTSVTPEHSRRFVETIRAKLPDCIINDRVGNGLGDYGTPEQFIPTRGEDRVFEVCMTMNDTWGFKKDDTNWKTPRTIIRNLVDIASKGGNYLLNVGPKADGTIPNASVRVLQEVGRWMDANAESIHGSSASPLPALPWGRCTVKPECLYLHVFDWPESGKLLVPGLRNAPKSVSLAADSGKHQITWTRLGPADLVLDLDAALLPAHALDAADTVIRVEYAGELDVDPSMVIAPLGYPITFRSADAEFRGEGFSYVFDHVWGIRQYITMDWKRPDQSLIWKTRIPAAGSYTVSITYGADRACLRSRYVVTIGGLTAAEAPVESTGGWHEPKTFVLGPIDLPAGGETELAVKPTQIGGSVLNATLMNLIEVTFTPVL